MTSELFATPYGDYALRRLPHDPTGTLRAWDAADSYLLDYLHEHFTAGKADTRVWIIDDSFGALGVACHGLSGYWSSDSAVARQAWLDNLTANKLEFTAQDGPANSISLLDNDCPALPANTDVVLMKVPKNQRYFAYLLQRLNALLPEGTPVLIGAMVKHLSKGFFSETENALTGFHTTLARKKARLLIGQTNSSKSDAATPPSLYQARDTEFGFTVFDTPNVFAGGKLDIGTRFFLEHFPTIEQDNRVIDLGCGNGMLGLYALQQATRQQRTIALTLVDESAHAIAATAKAVEAMQSESSGQIELLHQHCLQAMAADSADVVLCNPPFHQQHTVGIGIAQQMFRDSQRVLARGGVLYVIGNRHLGYHVELRKYFKRVETIASNRKFVLLKAIAGDR